MTETLRGTVHRVYHSGASFSAGVIETTDGARVRFAGKFCASAGDVVALVGKWQHDQKFGRQFKVETVSYDLPDSVDGLVHYLAKHPAFKGIGEATARKIVGHAGSADRLDQLVRGNLDEVHRALRVPMSTLESLRDAWIANACENDVRAYLASFGLTHHQMDTLLESYGNAIVGVLRADPYQLIKCAKGFGFKKVDKIARAMGTPKNHPGRIEAGILHVLNEEISDGHTWTGGADLLDKANELLILDTLDSRDVIQAAGMKLLASGDLVADGSAVTTPEMFEAEGLIHTTFAEHASKIDPVEGDPDQRVGLNAGQLEAYDNALRHRVSVITGGAGAGKSFLIARLAGTFKNAPQRVALCAPTGKAAKRIEELLRQKGLDLEAKTIHRLLGYNGREFLRMSLSVSNDQGIDENDNEDFEGDDEPYDVVIVDEASMVDVPLMAELIRRIDFNRTRLIIVGDHNQLPPVGPGNVLRDILHHKLVPATVLDQIVRQAGVLKANSTAILTQVIAPTAPNDSAWTLIDCFNDAVQIQAYLRELVLDRIPARLGLDPLRDVQIITPTHNGPLGTKAINQLMQYHLHGPVEGRFAVGDKVIQCHNDYDLGVMNGTIGMITSIVPNGYGVTFEGDGHRVIEGDRRQNLNLAWVITAHRAQGSEFPCVVVLCHRSHFFADRNWLYTAVTRAAKHCILIGDRWGLRNAVKKNQTIERRTLLSHWANAKSTTQSNTVEPAHA